MGSPLPFHTTSSLSCLGFRGLQSLLVSDQEQVLGPDPSAGRVQEDSFDSATWL
jgi:hypothetical protein